MEQAQIDAAASSLKAAQSLKAATEKVYYHRTPGAKFYVQIGSEAKEIAFAGGVVRLSSIPEAFREIVRAELDKVADIPTSHIYTKQAVQEPGEAMAEAEIMASAEGQFDADRKITGNPRTVPLPTSRPPAPELPSGIGAAKTAIASAGKV